MGENNSFLGEESEAAVAPSSDEKTLALLSHIITLVSSFIGPLIILSDKKG